MRILITGIAGLIGGSLAKWLLDNTDHKVFGVDDLSCGDRANIPHGIVGWNMIRLGQDDCRPIFDAARPDIVYHCAAYAAECLSPFIRRHNYMNNVVATADVVTQCINHDVGRLVYCSSMATYGRGRAPFMEDDECRPVDPYGVAKLASEQDIRIAGEQHGLDWVIVRPHNVYGPGQIVTQTYRNVLGIWMWRHLHGLPLRIYGDGQQRRAFSYIEDILRPMYLAGTAGAPSRMVINLGGSTPISVRDAATVVNDIVGGQWMSFCEPRHEVRDAWCTTDRSKMLLEYRDATPFDIGVEEMWKWAREHTHPEVDAIELETTKGIYSYWQDNEVQVASKAESQADCAGQVV